ncbi:hypothetical protein ACFPM0_01235 [Pseudonocardia sulfidoxydans]|uniref:hypothetical protein n=1 Tax=Pseudonocardia sulfidoxydans TaxID=54011 RepID=UPI0036135F6E
MHVRFVTSRRPGRWDSPGAVAQRRRWTTAGNVRDDRPIAMATMDQSALMRHISER